MKKYKNRGYSRTREPTGIKDKWIYFGKPN